MTNRMNAADRRALSRETDDKWADYAANADQRTKEENAQRYAQVEAGRARLRRN